MIDRLTEAFVEDTCEAAFEDAYRCLDEAEQYLDGTRAELPGKFDKQRLNGCDVSEIDELKARTASIYEQANYQARIFQKVFYGA